MPTNKHDSKSNRNNELIFNNSSEIDQATSGQPENVSERVDLEIILFGPKPSSRGSGRWPKDFDLDEFDPYGGKSNNSAPVETSQSAKSIDPTEDMSNDSLKNDGGSSNSSNPTGIPPKEATMTTSGRKPASNPNRDDRAAKETQIDDRLLKQMERHFGSDNNLMPGSF